ncbi:MAG: Glycine oxidase ThiO [Myxococcaceae bacterium]|nr:Glycine oxidase ThiO [Myxococcaceae bacterium]
MRVAIVGGGVMGCATALALAKRGAEVVLLERAVPGAEASSAAAGILGAQMEAPGGSPLLDLLVSARAGYGPWAEELRAETGIDIGFRVSGVLHVARTEAERDALAKAVAWQSNEGLTASLLEPKDARAIEPELSADIVAAAHFPDDAQIDPPSLLRALVAAVSRAGVTVRSGISVERVIVEGGKCLGVALASDTHEAEELRADATVLAAGSWSSLVPGIGNLVPKVTPARGQIVLLDERPPRLRTIVVGGDAYAVPRGDGRVLCGSTVEFVGFRRDVTAGGVHSILEGTLRVVPGLANATLASTWSSFRPFAVEGVPMIGKSKLPGLFLATGHHRNGILLAKVTGDRVASAIYASDRAQVPKPADTELDIDIDVTEPPR